MLGRAMWSLCTECCPGATPPCALHSSCRCYCCCCCGLNTSRNTSLDAAEAIKYNVDLKDIAGYIKRTEALLELDDIEGAREAVVKGLQTNSGSAELLELAEQISTRTLCPKGYK